MRWQKPPSTSTGKRGNIYYCAQVSAKPPTIAIFCSGPCRNDRPGTGRPRPHPHPRPRPHPHPHPHPQVTALTTPASSCLSAWPSPSPSGCHPHPQSHPHPLRARRQRPVALLQLVPQVPRDAAAQVARLPGHAHPVALPRAPRPGARFQGQGRAKRRLGFSVRGRELRVYRVLALINLEFYHSTWLGVCGCAGLWPSLCPHAPRRATGTAPRRPHGPRLWPCACAPAPAPPPPAAPAPGCVPRARAPRGPASTTKLMPNVCRLGRAAHAYSLI